MGGPTARIAPASVVVRASFHHHALPVPMAMIINQQVRYLSGVAYVPPPIIVSYALQELYTYQTPPMATMRRPLYHPHAPTVPIHPLIIQTLDDPLCLFTCLCQALHPTHHLSPPCLASLAVYSAPTILP